MRGLAIVAALACSSCVSLSGVRQYASDKAQRLAECQLQDLSEEQAKACLGAFARDLGTKACKEADAWLESLHGPRPNE